jgi:RNA polymerase sigma-70 factor (ECF subfamily)
LHLTNPYNEKEVLAALAQGNETAFATIYHRYHSAIYLYLLDFVKVPHLAEDLVHEVFMKIWEIRARLNIKTSFSSYLYRISHNKAIDALKMISADQALRNEVIRWLEPQLPEFDSVAGRTRHYEQLMGEAVASLPPQRQKVFILCREEGKTYEEAAAELGISRNTVKEHMVHSVRFLRQYLSERGGLAFMVILMEKLF